MTTADTSLPQPVAPDWNSIEAESLTSQPTLINKSLLRLELKSAAFFLQVTEVGVRLYSKTQREYDYGLVVSEPAVQDLSLVLHEDFCIVDAKALSIEIGYAPFTLTVTDKRSGRVLSRTPSDGHFVRRHRIPPLAKTETGWLFSHELRSSEPVYGLGEKWGALNKRGQFIRSYNVDALGVNAEISYKNCPFCWSPEGWGVFVHTPSIVTHAVGYPAWSQRAYTFHLEDDVFDLYLFVVSPEKSTNVGATMLANYTELTGRAPLPPVWSGGVILSKAYYQDPEELLNVAREVRRRNMPCDTITIDGRAWQDTDTRFAFEWDKSRWPDPKPVLDELKQLGFKVCIWEYPLISMQHDWYQIFDDKGWFLKDQRTGGTYEYDWDQQAFGRVLTPLPKSGIVDFTNPDAFKFWLDAHKALFDVGVDMIKADFGEQLEDDNMLASNGETGMQLHNVYAHLYNKCVYQAAEKFSPSGPFLFSRSAWTGCQRYNSQWGGDPQADWEGMMGNIRGGLSWGLTGAPFYATDIGGFYKDTRNNELYVRWAQAAVFSAHYRLHGIGAREPWSYSVEAEAAVNKTLSLRYQLQTYLQKTMIESTETGLPVQRPMVLAFPQQKQSWAFENQFMFGNELLVAPCFNADGRVEIYLPDGEWLPFDLDGNSDEALSGGQLLTLDLALDEIAVYCRAGARIPVNHKVLSTQQLPRSKQNSDLLEADYYWPA